MDVKTTEKGTKKFTKEEKLAILKEARETSVKATLEKYALYPATFYYWKVSPRPTTSCPYPFLPSPLREMDKTVQLVPSISVC